MEQGMAELGPLTEGRHNDPAEAQIDAVLPSGRTLSLLRPPGRTSLPLPRSVAALTAASLGLALAALAVHMLHERGPGGLRSAAVQSKVMMGSCHTTVPGERCHARVMWAMTKGIHKNNAWYIGVNTSSTFEDFQAYFHLSHYGHCPVPCKAPPNSPTPKTLEAEQEEASCLCLFDVDRTLTGKQDAQCPGNRPYPGVWDSAFAGGDLTLSQLGQSIGSTFCSQCHLGLVSAGGAGGPEEKHVLLGRLAGDGELRGLWSGPGAITSPLVTGCGDNVKHICAKGIVDWYQRNQGIRIPDHEVYFFDDHQGNTARFAEFGYNARQVSCASREGAVGLCGAVPSEVIRAPGISNCR